MTAQAHEEQKQQEDELVEWPESAAVSFVVQGSVVCSQDETKQGDTSDEEQDILEIIEELSTDDEQEETKREDNDDHDNTSSSNSKERGSNEFEFSLSSITFALGDALQGSAAALQGSAAALQEGAASLGNATDKLRQSLTKGNNHSNSSSTPQPQFANHHYRNVLRATSSPKKKKTKPVDFGDFSDRAAKLQYTQEDLFDIVDDPAQFTELRNALRSLGAVTNTIVQQKLHWYVKNNKRERARLAELKREQEEAYRQQQAMQEEPTTPPTETKVIDLRKGGLPSIAEEDDSPKGVREIFVPPS